MSAAKDSYLEEYTQKSLKNLNPGSITGFPMGFPSSPESFSSMPFPMVPPHLWQAMNSNLPPEKVREMLTEQAEMLDQMVLKMKTFNEEEPDLLKGNLSRRNNELEKEPREFVSEKNFSLERKDDFLAQRDLEMLRQELSTVKIREEATYLDLQKAHHQIHMLESQLLELQRKHFSELEHLSFENAEMRRRLEAAEYRNSSLQKENDFLKSQVAGLRRHVEGYSINEYKFEYIEPRTREERSEPKPKKDYSPDESLVYRRDAGTRISVPEPQQYFDVSVEDSTIRRKIAAKPENTNEDDFRREESIKKKNYMPVRTIVNTSSNVTEALNWRSHQPRADPSHNVHSSLQAKLNTLQSEHERLESEIDNLSESKYPGAIKRRSDLELELSICQSNINSVTSKLRKISWLSNS